MGYWCSVAIALWKPDYNDLVLKAKENEAVKGSVVEKMIANAIPVRTPDETYMILNIDWDKWYADTDAHKFLKDFYKDLTDYVKAKENIPSDTDVTFSIVSIDFGDYRDGDDYKVLFERTRYMITRISTKSR